MAESPDCILCQSNRKKVLFSSCGRGLVRCLGCGLIFTSPRAGSEELYPIYENNYKANLESAKDVLIRTARERLAFVQKYIKTGSLLDVGCGMGYFLNEAKENGWQVKGVEVSGHAIEHCKSSYGLDVVPPDTDNDNSKYDCITMWHIIEHLRDPLEYIKHIKDRLNDDGFLVVEVPNNNFLFEWLRPNNMRSISELNEHLYYFNSKTLLFLLESAGFDVRAVTLGRIYPIRNCVNEKIIQFFAGLGRFIYRLTGINAGNTIRVVAVKSKNLAGRSKKINVLHISGSSGWGGGERYIKDVLENIDSRFFNIEVVCPEPGIFIDRVRKMGGKAGVIDMSSLFSVRAIFRLAAHIRKNKIDIVQSHGARSNFYARLAKLFCPKIKVISTVHNSLYDYDIGKFRKLVYVVADRVTSGLSDMVVTVSASLARDLIDKSRYSAFKVMVIHNGVDFAKFNVDKADGLKVRNDFKCVDAAFLGVVGRITQQKGHIYLLEAFKAVSAKFSAVKLLVVGDGPLMDALKEQSKMIGIADKVIFTGAREDIPDILSAVDIVVCPSISEGFPYSVLEAMVMGKPIIASSVNGIPEMLEDGKEGILVKPRDAAMLAANIEKLLKDVELKSEIAKNAYARARKDFGVGIMVSRLQECYGKVFKI